MRKLIKGIMLAAVFTILATSQAFAGSTPEGGVCTDDSCCVSSLICENGVCAKQGGSVIIWNNAKVQSYEVKKVSEGIYDISLLGKNMRESRDYVMINTDTVKTTRSGKTYTLPFEFGTWRYYSETMRFYLPSNAVQNEDGSYTVYVWLKNWHGTGEVISINVK